MNVLRRILTNKLCWKSENLHVKKVTNTVSHTFVIGNGCRIFVSVKLDGCECYFWASMLQNVRMHVSKTENWHGGWANESSLTLFLPTVLWSTRQRDNSQHWFVLVPDSRESTVHVYFYMSSFSILFVLFLNLVYFVPFSLLYLCFVYSCIALNLQIGN